jgi:hypothetical protein
VPLLPISDGSRWQTLVLAGLGIPSAALPQRGTVSASALDLAFYLTRGKIFITGLDLAIRDIRSHVRPYSFDALWEKKAGRLNPVYSQSFGRAATIRAGGSLGIYASWFGRQLEAWPRRLFTLGENNPVFEALGTSDPGNGLPEKDQNPRQKPFRTLGIKKRKNPSREAALLIKAALQDPRYGGETAGELASLLFPGREPVPTKELEDAVFSLAGWTP